MREPVLQDKRQEHLKFCKYGVLLMERVSGKQPTSNVDITLEKLRKVNRLDCMKYGGIPRVFRYSVDVRFFSF